VHSFAYPYGRNANITEGNRAVIREAGFRCCCAAFGGLVRPATDPYRLLRVPVNSDYASPPAFGFEVALGRTLIAH
jgi:hypothetical protein